MARSHCRISQYVTPPPKEEQQPTQKPKDGRHAPLRTRHLLQRPTQHHTVSTDATGLRGNPDIPTQPRLDFGGAVTQSPRQLRRPKVRLLGDLRDNLLRERQSGGCPGRGSVTYRHHPIAARHDEVAQEIAVSADSLCPHAGSGLREVVGLNRWHIPLKLPDVCTPVEGPPGFYRPSPPMSAGYPPHSRQAQEFTNEPRVDVAPPVAVTRESQHCVGPNEYFSTNGGREVDAEERIARIRQRVDQPIHESFRRTDETHVLAAERDDSRIRGTTGCPGQLIRMETGTDDHPAGRERDAVTSRERDS